MDKLKSTLCTSVLLLLIYVRFIHGETINDTETLMDDLFTKANYNKDFRGITDQSKALRVGAKLSVVTFGEIKETEEAFEVMGLLYLSWFDERLMWNSTQYNGTSELVIFQEKVWKPEVKLANPMYGITSLGDERTQLRLYNTGLVYWMTPDLFRASCKLDVVSFPWDRQSCSLNFIVAAYLPKEVIIEAESDTINIKSLEENESWEVVETKAITLNGVNSQVQFWICVERRPYFQICVVFLPIVFLSMLNPFVFFIKVDSGERISFSITLLLSITLNLSMVATNLPTHSRKMSAMIFSLDYVLLESTFICLMSIFSLHMYHKQGIPSRFWQHVTFTCLRRRTRRVSDSADTQIVKTLPDDNLKEYDDNGSVDMKPNDLAITWRDVSHLIDIAFFIVSFIAILSSFLFLTIYVVMSKVECKQ